MNIDAEIPYKICLHQPRREDRRRQVSEMFRMHRLRVLRWPGAEAGNSRHPRGFAHMPQRAHYLSTLLAIREARRRGEKAILIFEDDAVFHDDFRNRVEDLHPPDDWGMLYLGCLHVATPQLVAPNLMRVSRGLDNHAVAIHGRFFDMLLQRMLPAKLPGGRENSEPFDCVLSSFHGEIPTYAAWPNLVWQREGYSDMSKSVVGNYFSDGSQRFMAEAVAGIR